MTSCVSGTVSGTGDKLGARLKSSYSYWLRGVMGTTSPGSLWASWDGPGQRELEKSSSQFSRLAWVLLNGVYKPDGKTELLRATEGIFSALTKEDFSESCSSSKEKRLHHTKVKISKRKLACMLLYYMEGNEIIHGKYSAPCLKHTKNQYHLVVIIILPLPLSLHEIFINIFCQSFGAGLFWGEGKIGIWGKLLSLALWWV